jgi:phosphatidylserine decarboxylase
LFHFRFLQRTIANVRENGYKIYSFSKGETMDHFFAPIHRAGWPFITLSAVITLILFFFSGMLGGLGLILTVWCVYFFRNPRRVTPLGEGLIISPADGIVTKIEKATPPPELKWSKKPLMRISIFLNVFDVHTNRIPIDGTITKIKYNPGKFINASLDKASDLNERNSVIIQTPSNHNILVVQIAGLIARRILCEIKEDQEVKAGETFGIIRFGSRVDLYLPEGIHPQVIEGQRMISGETILADLRSSHAQRQGIKRL